MARLILVPFGALPEDVPRELSRRVLPALPLSGSAVAPPADPSFAFDPERGQYGSTRLVEALAAGGLAGPGDRVLGVIDADLFVPILTFVFGEAMLRGPAGVLSLTRLRPEFYGLPPDPRLLFERVEKEALHELGHTFGLIHCRRPDCVMRASTNAGEVDLKPAAFCRSCAKSLR